MPFFCWKGGACQSCDIRLVKRQRIVPGLTSCIFVFDGGAAVCGLLDPVILLNHQATTYKSKNLNFLKLKKIKINKSPSMKKSYKKSCKPTTFSLHLKDNISWMKTYLEVKCFWTLNGTMLNCMLRLLTKLHIVMLQIHQHLILKYIISIIYDNTDTTLKLKRLIVTLYMGYYTIKAYIIFKNY